jgi:hypothetical protein
MARFPRWRGVTRLHPQIGKPRAQRVANLGSTQRHPGGTGEQHIDGASVQELWLQAR